MFWVTICPVRMVTPETRPSTSSIRVMAESLVASATTVRITRSPSSIGLRPGMSRAATTTSRMTTSSLGKRLLAWRATKTIPATITAISTPTAR
jgi:hypothetical protein